MAEKDKTGIGQMVSKMITGSDPLIAVREALQKGLERFRNEVIENQAKLEAL